MKILLVDDSQADLDVGRYELLRLGHQVVAACGVDEALAVFRRERPEVLITEIFLPGGDGFALTREVQQLAAPHWQPVIFLTAQRDEDLQVKALEAGAESYVLKPLGATLLHAKLTVIQRLLDAQRQAESRAYELERHYIIQEEDKRVARHLLSRLIDLGKLADPALSRWYQQSASFGGDLAAAARTPGGVLHLLLAGGTGHGLTASINMLPIMPPFYRMTEKGFGLDAIAREMNRKTRHFLPPDRSIVVTLVGVDFRESLIHVWNGGNPEPRLLDAAGATVGLFAKCHLALGVMDDEAFDGGVETHPFGGGSQLLLFSEGLLEAEPGNGDRFGQGRLTEALRGGGPASARLQRVSDAVNRHLGERSAERDMLALLVDLQPPPARTVAELPAAPADSPGSWRVALRLGARELRQVDVVPALLELVAQFEGNKGGSGQLFVVLSELFNNALEHGLLRLDSCIKTDAGMESWLAEREDRLARLAKGEVDLEIERLEEGGRQWLRITCRDSGPGFDRSVLPARERLDLPFGRGVAIVKSLCARLEYNKAGNAATAFLAIGEGSPD